MTEAVAPAYRVLDAVAAGLDERSLRSSARGLAEHCGAQFTSRSYRYPYAIVAWHDTDVGVDIEQVTRTGPALSDVICTPTERVEMLSAESVDVYLSSLWCAKEALAKALGDARLYNPSRLEAPSRWPLRAPVALGGRDAEEICQEVRGTGRWLAAPVRVPDGFVGWLCWSSGPAERVPTDGHEPLGR